jgi:hydroxypyruvate isomerase
LVAPALAALPVRAEPASPEGEVPGVPFKISVMLWTVFQKLPFEERLEKVAEAGYHANDITILLENIDLEENPRYYLWSVAEGFEIITRVGHPRVKFLDDFFHEQISEGNLIEKLEKNIDKLGLVHVAGRTWSARAGHRRNQLRQYL